MDDLFLNTILRLFVHIFDFLSNFIRFFFPVYFFINFSKFYLSIRLCYLFFRNFGIRFLPRLIPGFFPLLNLRKLVSLPDGVGICHFCRVRLVDQLSLHTEGLDSFHTTGIADFLFVNEVYLEVANEAIPFHLDNLVWHAFDISAFSILLVLFLLVLLGKQYFLFDPDLFDRLFARGATHVLGLITDNKFVFPGLLVELFTIGVGWSLLVRFLFLLLGFGLTLITVTTFASIPIATVLWAAAKALAQLTGYFSFLRIGFDTVGVIQLIKLLLVDDFVFFALHSFQIIRK